MKNTTRQNIVDTALVMFRQTHNIKKVSLEDIAQAAKISPTTIYNHFGNREALLCEVVKILVRQNLAQGKELIHADITFPQKLLGIINNKKDMVSQVDREVIEKIVSQDRTMAAFIDEVYQNEVKPLWVEMLADGKKQGYIDPALSDEALLIYLDVLKTGFSMKQELMQSIATRVDLLMQLTRILFYGFLKKEIGMLPEEDKKTHDR